MNFINNIKHLFFNKYLFITMLGILIFIFPSSCSNKEIKQDSINNVQSYIPEECSAFWKLLLSTEFGSALPNDSVATYTLACQEKENEILHPIIKQFRIVKDCENINFQTSSDNQAKAACGVLIITHQFLVLNYISKHFYSNIEDYDKVVLFYKLFIKLFLKDRSIVSDEERILAFNELNRRYPKNSLLCNMDIFYNFMNFQDKKDLKNNYSVISPKIKKCLEIDPNNKFAFAMNFMVLQTFDENKFILDLNNSIKNKQLPDYAYYILSQYYWSHKNKSKALSYLKKAMVLNKDNIEYKNYMTPLKRIKRLNLQLI